MNIMWGVPQSIFGSANQTVGTTANWKPRLIPHWQSYCPQARPVKQCKHISILHEVNECLILRVFSFQGCSIVCEIFHVNDWLYTGARKWVLIKKIKTSSLPLSWPGFKPIISWAQYQTEHQMWNNVPLPLSHDLTDLIDSLPAAAACWSRHCVHMCSEPTSPTNEQVTSGLDISH